MNEQDLKETFDFEWQIAQLMLADERWTHNFTLMKFTTASKHKAYRNGDIYLSTTKYQDSRDYKALRHDIRCLFADLHSGFIPHHNFCWQRIAKKLGAITETDAQDLAECTYCGILTPLTTSKRCVQCKTIEDAVLLDLDLAYEIVKANQPMEFTQEEKNEYGIEED